MANSMRSSASTGRPLGLEWRSSVWFVTLVVGFGVATDLFSYAVIIPVIPFRLEALGYSDASARTGWLLFAYSGGLAVSTPPIAWFSERYNARRIPLLLGLVTLIGAQVMFMLAPFYWLMALARIIQGVSSTFVWTVGLALLCDTVPEARVGQQLGLAMAGLSAGVVLAPPIGGALYQSLGFNAPFIFSIGIVLVDLVGRLLVIERKHAIPWGVDPAAMPATQASDSRTIHADHTAALDKNAMTSPKPNEVLPSADPVVLAGLDGKLVVVERKHNDIVFPEAETRTSSSEQHDETTTAEATPPAAMALGNNSRSPATGETGSPAVFFDTAGQLAVVGNKDQSPRKVYDKSLEEHCLDSSDANVHNGVQPPQPPVMQGGALEKAEQSILPQPSSNDLAVQERLDEAPQLTSMQVLSAMCHSRRAVAAFSNTLIYGVTYSTQEPTLPLRLQNPYGMSSLKVGLVYIASSVPTLLSGPLAGWLSDRKGTGLITIVCLLLAIPWFIVMAIHGPLALLIIGVVISNFFISAVVAPLTAELAAVTRELPGVGYSHVYGAFNLAYGIGSAIGPLLGGQLYDHLQYGWTAVVGLAAGLMLAAATVAFFFTDEIPVAKRLLGLRGRRLSGNNRGAEA
ncbi:major facilitator superfamily domain-containing protein [Gautieria morchelliformis]|nr:major facilitator superfamily domain-containing protein [Gautieria morchelliformis]